METTSLSPTTTRTSSSPLFFLLDSFFFYAAIFIKVHNFFSKFCFFLLSQLSLSSPSSNPKAIRLVKQVSDCECELSKQEILCHGGREEEEEEEDDDDDGKIVDRDEVEMVMGKLGLFCSPESEELKEGYGFNEICGVFDEEEARLEEVKEAFDVFDENRDGFIDAGELQRVLCVLGLKEATEMENCHKMIARFDENGDGRIGFEEFVKIMENSFQ